MSCCYDDLNQALAMADHHHYQPMTAVAYSRKQIADSAAFMDDILADLAATSAPPDVGHELVLLLAGLGKDDAAAAVRSRAAELLREHPAVLHRFAAHVDMDMDMDAAAAAARHGQALAFVKRVHETAGPVVHGRFLAVLADAAAEDGDMFADEISDRARKAFGPAHVGLLHAFATAWLPGEHEWRIQQQQARAPAAARRQRSRRQPRAPMAAAAANSSHAADGSSMPDVKKKKMPCAADDGDNGRRRHDDHVVAVLEVRNTKKRRGGGDDDGNGTTARGSHALLRVGESSGGGGAAPPPQTSRAKKLRSGNGEFSGGAAAAAARVLGGGGANANAGVVHVHHNAYGGDNGKKPPPRRRAAMGGGKSSSAAGPTPAQQQPDRDGEVRRYRQEWEFQTNYSKLVATSGRVTELLRMLKRRPHGDGDGGGGGGDRSMEALFPLPECREFLRSYYGVRWGEMVAALECGESRVPALEAMERSLARKEEEAVAEELRKRWRHDAGRVAQRLHGLAAMDKLLHKERRRRPPHHGGGA